MVEAELLIGRLRNQVRSLQSLLNCLESRGAVEREDYAYSYARLRELIGSLKALEHLSSERGQAHQLRAAWLN